MSGIHFNRGIDVVIKLSPPGGDYRFLYSSSRLIDLVSPLSLIIADLSRRSRIHFIKHSRHGGINYVVVGRSSYEVNPSRGQEAVYLYTFILKASDFARHHIDLGKLFGRIVEYRVLYGEIEKGFTPNIEPISIDDVEAQGVNDWSTPIINQGGYIYYTGSLNEALQIYMEKCRNAWLRILFDFIFAENYERILPNTIVFSYNNRRRGVNVEVKLSDKLLDIGYVCRYLYPKPTIDQYSFLDDVENCRERIKDIIARRINEHIILSGIEATVRGMESFQAINRGNIEHLNELLARFLNSRWDFELLNRQYMYYEYSRRVFEAIVSHIPGSLNEMVEVLEYVREKPVEPLRSFLQENGYINNKDKEIIMEVLSKIDSRQQIQESILRYISKHLRKPFSDELRKALDSRMRRVEEACSSIASTISNFDNALNDLKKFYNNLGSYEKLLSSLDENRWWREYEGKAKKYGKLHKIVRKMIKVVQKLMEEKRMAAYGFSY